MSDRSERRTNEVNFLAASKPSFFGPFLELFKRVIKALPSASLDQHVERHKQSWHVDASLIIDYMFQGDKCATGVECIERSFQDLFLLGK